MPLLAKADSLIEATLWCETLKASGYPAYLKNTLLVAASGELPPEICRPEVWLDNEEELKEARSLIADLIDGTTNPAQSNKWCCPRCGELLEGQFGQCWKCGADKPHDAPP